MMRETGNAGQWGSTYPPQALLEEDIEQERLYVLEEAGAVIGVFAFDRVAGDQ